MSRTGRRPGAPETREEILVAARRAFGDRGYEATSLRSIAARVPVDPALLVHYFGSKDGLFAAALEVTFGPVGLFSGLEGLDPAEAAELIVRRYLSVLDQEQTRDVVLSLVRSAVSSERAATMLREFLVAEMIGSLGASINESDGQLRASLMVAQLDRHRHAPPRGEGRRRRPGRQRRARLARRARDRGLSSQLHEVESRSDLLGVPGATLYYKVQGTGPLLLMLQGGDGDADATDSLAKHLVDTYTVLSYDRRGLSRSRLDDPSAAVELTTHSDDASRLLQAVTDEPALVFGASLGALLGLDLVSRHVEQVKLLVAHEPPATELLAEADREVFVRGQEEVEELHRRRGTAVAMRRFIALTGVDTRSRARPRTGLAQPRADLTSSSFSPATCRGPSLPPRPAGAARCSRADPPGRRPFGWGRSCLPVCASPAEELAWPLQEFPGGHAGYVLRPRAFAARLAGMLDSSSSS